MKNKYFMFLKKVHKNKACDGDGISDQIYMLKL